MHISRQAMKFFAARIRQSSSQDMAAKSDFELLRDLAVEKRGLLPSQFRRTRGGMEVELAASEEAR